MRKTEKLHVWYIICRSWANTFCLRLFWQSNSSKVWRITHQSFFRTCCEKCHHPPIRNCLWSAKMHIIVIVVSNIFRDLWYKTLQHYRRHVHHIPFFHISPQVLLSIRRNWYLDSRPKSILLLLLKRPN